MGYFCRISSTSRSPGKSNSVSAQSISVFAMQPWPEPLLPALSAAQALALYLPGLTQLGFWQAVFCPQVSFVTYVPFQSSSLPFWPSGIGRHADAEQG